MLLLITATSIAVIAFFARNPSGESGWHRLIAPGLATVALAVIVFIALDNFAILLGVAPDSTLRWALPAVYPVAALLGVIWALVLRARRPEVYATIGLGPESATAGSVPDGDANRQPVGSAARP